MSCFHSLCNKVDVVCLQIRQTMTEITITATTLKDCVQCTQSLKLLACSDAYAFVACSDAVMHMMCSSVHLLLIIITKLDRVNNSFLFCGVVPCTQGGEYKHISGMIIPYSSVSWSACDWSARSYTAKRMVV